MRAPLAAAPLAAAPLVAAPLVAAAVALAGCGASTPTAAPATLLQQAKATVDAARSIHYELSSSGGTSASGLVIVGGSGDAARPDELRGSFRVTDSGIPVTVAILAAGGRFYAQLPFQTGFTPTDPSQYGIGQPAQLLDPAHGLSSLLTAMTGLHQLGEARVGGEVVDRVSGSLPGRTLTVLPDVAPDQPVTATAAIVPSSHQLRQIVLTGPFSSPTPSTYTVTLTRYDEPVTITAPAG